jgi:hypothetical protein
MPVVDNKSLKGKLEAAFAQVISENCGRSNLTILRGSSSDERIEGDRVVCACQQGPEEPLGSGNRWMEVTVYVDSRADKDPETNPDPEGNHNANINAVFEDVLSRDDITDLLNATQQNFTAMMFFDDGEDADFAGRDFVETRKYRVYCCNTTIT